MCASCGDLKTMLQKLNTKSKFKSCFAKIGVDAVENVPTNGCTRYEQKHLGGFAGMNPNDANFHRKSLRNA